MFNMLKRPEEHTDDIFHGERWVGVLSGYQASVVLGKLRGYTE